MSKAIVLKKSPKIEFQFFDSGFLLVDELIDENTGFYTYDDLQSIELNNIWYPRFAKYLRIFTWIANGGVPFFPDAESCKKANIMLRLKDVKLGMWLTDTDMANKAKALKELLKPYLTLNAT